MKTVDEPGFFQAEAPLNGSPASSPRCSSPRCTCKFLICTCKFPNSNCKFGNLRGANFRDLPQENGMKTVDEPGFFQAEAPLNGSPASSHRCSSPRCTCKFLICTCKFPNSNCKFGNHTGANFRDLPQENGMKTVDEPGFFQAEAPLNGSPKSSPRCSSPRCTCKFLNLTGANFRDLPQENDMKTVDEPGFFQAEA